MLLARVRGEVVATIKDPELSGKRLVLVEPVTETLDVLGDPFVALDIVSSRPGDLVMYIDAREAPKALPDRRGPIDACIVGLIDSAR
jgi:ethanolamine utilization protein EutN